jgi:ribosomal protein S18 acetylase RimI-like enzyme
MPVIPATPSDIPQILALLNSAYRGDESKKGWTTEADLLIGEHRTDLNSLTTLFQTKDVTFLKYENDGVIVGSVMLHKKGNRLYLGMLSVNPALQAKGTGKKLMNAAIKHAQHLACESIYMTVISVRKELIAWYERQGYHPTGEIQPFPVDERFGKPTQHLEFVVLEKHLR